MPTRWVLAQTVTYIQISMHLCIAGFKTHSLSNCLGSYSYNSYTYVKKHNIEIINNTKVIIHKKLSHYNTVACDFAVLCKFYNTLIYQQIHAYAYRYASHM